jgi:hypothetical protein
MWRQSYRVLEFLYAHGYQLWAAVGPLVGVAIGAWLSARWQRAKWILDNKTSEYRNLFDAISSYRFVLTEYHALYKTAMVAVPAQKKYDDDIKLAKATETVANVFADRIFTRQALRESGATDDWAAYNARQLCDIPPDIKECGKLLNAIQRKIVNACQNDLRLGGARTTLGTK